MWDAALAGATAAGCQVRIVSAMSEAAGAKAVPVLGEGLAPDEAREIGKTGLPIFLLPKSKPAAQTPPEATVLPGDEAAQNQIWSKLLTAGGQP